jgi:hypothetical protein
MFPHAFANISLLPIITLPLVFNSFIRLQIIIVLL